MSELTNFPRETTMKRIAEAMETMAQSDRASADSMFKAMLTKDNWKQVRGAWFAYNGSAVVADLTQLVERWYRIMRLGWTGGTQFYNPDQSELSTGTKVGDNEGMSCTPSTNTTTGQDDYANIPLFAVSDCNWYLDAEGKRHIRAIYGVDSLYSFVRNDPSKPVGVLQMAPWIKETQEETTYTFWMTDQEGATGYVPVSEAVDLDGTVHSWVVHSKYGMGDAYSSIGGFPIRVWDVSHNTCRTAIPSALGSNVYCGKSCADDAWMKMHVYIKYASLTLDGIMNGCCDYYRSDYHPAVAENGVKRVLLTTTQGLTLLVGSTVCLGSAGYGSKATQCSSLDRVKIVSIETVTVNETSYSAVNLDIPAPIDVATDLFLTTMQWYTGSTDGVLGNDGSPFNNTSNKEPYKLQGIEQGYGCYEVFGDTILKYTQIGGQNVLGFRVCRDATKISSLTNTSYVDAGYTVNCPETSGWTYIKRLGWNPLCPECWGPKVVGGSSSTFARDAAYIEATGNAEREWLALGSLYNGLTNTGLSCLHDNSLGSAHWSIGGRLSPNGSRGEYAA